MRVGLFVYPKRRLPWGCLAQSHHDCPWIFLFVDSCTRHVIAKNKRFSLEVISSHRIKEMNTGGCLRLLIRVGHEPQKLGGGLPPSALYYWSKPRPTGITLACLLSFFRFFFFFFFLLGENFGFLALSSRALSGRLLHQPYASLRSKPRSRINPLQTTSRGVGWIFRLITNATSHDRKHGFPRWRLSQQIMLG